jgi:hypothetical protein
MDRTAVLVLTDALGVVQPNFPTIVSSSTAVTYLELPRSRSELTLYVATFSASVAATFATCGITIDGTESPPPTAELYTSNPFDPSSASGIELHQVSSLPVIVRYQRACGAPTVCAQTGVEVWPLAAAPLGAVVPFSDDLALAMTNHADGSGAADRVLRLDWATKTTTTAGVSLFQGVALLPFRGHAVAVDLLGHAFELDPNLGLVTTRSYNLVITAFGIGSDGSTLLATNGCTGPGGVYSVRAGTWSSTASQSLTCVGQKIDHIAVDRHDWGAYAIQDIVQVFAGTATVPRLTADSADFTALGISPSAVVAGPRTLTWSLLTRDMPVWQPIPRPSFPEIGRSAVFTPKGSIIAGGDGGALGLYTNGVWCSIPLSMPVDVAHMALYGLAIAPSGRTAFAAMYSTTDGALLRLSLPPDL